MLGVPAQAGAIYDPLEKANNMHGIHILFPSELTDAAALVNSTNGEWGYVTIPIQVTDRDLTKWQAFMDECREKKLIPIVRLATEPYFKDTSVWRKPNNIDVIDFANFLNSLDWPVENRYIIVFNEINRFDEWGGEAPSPKEYGEILSFAVDVFKKRSQDFYIIMGGLDNASPNDRIKYMDNLVFIKEMIDSNQDLPKKIDGFSSHSYPNPGFSQPPDAEKEVGTATYKSEFELINKTSGKRVPAFITETGWTNDNLSDETIASYYETAYKDIWEKDSSRIVAITPFLLNSTGGQFENFSFVINGQRTQHFERAEKMEKVKGLPVETEVKGVEVAAPYKKVEKFFASNLLANINPTENLVIEYIRFFF